MIADINPTSATVNNDALMLLEAESCARGKRVKTLRNERAAVKYITDIQGYNMRIQPNNVQKLLESDEEYVFDLKILLTLQNGIKSYSVNLRSDSNRVIELTLVQKT
jgi:hypothetical protein